MPTVSFNQHFPGYEILGELGRSNARVLKARNQFTGELVAIKHFAINTDHETLVRFQRESGIMTSINHPNIVKVRELHLDADLPYIVMELVEGGDLRALLKEKGSLDVSSTIRFGTQMAQAFKAIHEKGIIHRDIKPENIMYRHLASGEIHFLLTDFGIAKIREQSSTVTGTSLMTYEYASPEQFDNPKSVTSATDYYSLGVVMYECLAGHVPFPLIDGRVHTLIKQVMDSPPPAFFLQSAAPVPKTMEKLITRLLIKKEADRLKDPLSLLRMLKHTEMEELGEPVPYEPSPSPPLSTSAPRSVPVSYTPPPATSKPVLVGVTKPQKKRKSNLALIVILIFVIIPAIILSIIAIGSYQRNRKENTTPTEATDSISSVSQLPMDTTTPAIQDTVGKDFEPSVPLIRLTDGNFEEHFANNFNDWPEVKTAETEMGFFEEQYRIKGLTNLSHSRIIKDFAMDLNKNFTVTLYVKWVSGIVSNGFGLYYCSDQIGSSYYCFLISENGQFTIQHKKGNLDWEILKAWTPSSNINQNGRWNLLKIDKQDDGLYFYINNIFVEQLPFNADSGNYSTGFGLIASAAQTVDFDDLVIKSGN